MESSADDVRRFDACEEHLDYHFKNRHLLEVALTHASDKAGRIELAAENGDDEEDAPELFDNERLEFLGDSVLGMVVCDELFSAYPDASEGELTNIKSVVVSRSVLAKISDDLGIPEFMSLGKGMTTYNRLPESLRANVFEAVTAAIYLDGGMERARTFVLRHVRKHITMVEQDEHRKNYKSTLQQYTQREFSITPSYRVVNEQGPDHIKEFEIVALIGERAYGTGQGKSKKDAEQAAAKATLKMLKENAE